MPKPKTHEEIIAALKTNPAYSHIDIDRELKKADAWCMVNNRRNTPRFFVNWLNRIEQPLRPSSPPARGGVAAASADGVVGAPIEDPICPHCGQEYCLKTHRDKEGI